MQKCVSFWLFASSVAALAAASAAGQDLKGKAKVVISAHDIETKADHLYVVKVDGNGFVPRISMTPGRLNVTQDFRKPENVIGHFLSTKNERNTIVVLPDTFQLRGKGPFEYDFEVTSTPLASMLDVQGELIAEDPPFGDGIGARKHHKSYELKAKANQHYVIDMKQAGGRLDSYLNLLDGAGKVVAHDDDGGGFPNARIVFRAPADGDYRIIATGLGDALGKFALTVKSTK